MEDFEPIVTELSLTASRLRDVFYLSDPPRADSVRVFVDNALVDCGSGVWTLQQVPHEETLEPVWAIVFDRLNLPSPGQQIAVRYDRGEPDLAAFCGGAP